MGSSGAPCLRSSHSACRAPALTTIASKRTVESLLHETLGAIPLWPPRPTQMFRVHDVLSRSSDHCFVRRGTITDLMGDMKAVKELERKPFGVTQRHSISIEDSIGAKLALKLLGTTTASVDANFSNAKNFTLELEGISIERVENVMELWEELKNAGISDNKCAMFTKGVVYLVTEAIFVSKFSLKCEGETNIKLAAEAGGTAPQGVGASAGFTVDHLHVAQNSITYDNSKKPLVLAISCLSFTGEDGAVANIKERVRNLASHEGADSAEEDRLGWYGVDTDIPMWTDEDAPVSD